MLISFESRPKIQTAVLTSVRNKDFINSVSIPVNVNRLYYVILFYFQRLLEVEQRSNNV